MFCWENGGIKKNTEVLLLMLSLQGRSAQQQLLPRAPIQSGRRALIDRHNKRPTNLLWTLRRYRRLLMRSLHRRRHGALPVTSRRHSMT